MRLTLDQHSLSHRPRYFSSLSISGSLLLPPAWLFFWIHQDLLWTPSPASFQLERVVTSWVSSLLFFFLWTTIRRGWFKACFLRPKGSGSTCLGSLGGLQSSRFCPLRYLYSWLPSHHLLIACKHLPSETRALPT